MPDVTPLLVPQVNVNDETVLLVRWTVPQFAEVTAGGVVCEVETSKATSEVTADRSGVLMQSAPVGVRVRIGEAIGAIGPTQEAVAAFADSLATATTKMASVAPSSIGIRATPKARALAERHGIALADVAPRAHGTVKETDVQQFLSDHPTISATQPAPAVDTVRTDSLEYVGTLSPFESAVAATLRRSTADLILTSIDRDCRLTTVNAAIERALSGGRMLSVLHFVIAAAARALPRHARLISVLRDGSLYRHRSIEVAFVARTDDGRLFTPVLRGADQLDVAAIAKACQAATFKIVRGAIKADELEGACFTVSQVPVPGTTRVVALPNSGQSAILGVSSERTVLELHDGAVVQRPVVTLTLTYDHALCDGVYAAEFLADMSAILEGGLS
jgi:pyruvate dehydrogenase E2 component (dihydrolipoamide acetyltransferase)